MHWFSKSHQHSTSIPHYFSLKPSSQCKITNFEHNQIRLTCEVKESFSYMYSVEMTMYCSGIKISKNMQNHNDIATGQISTLHIAMV
jgi:hypothetical protein